MFDFWGVYFYLVGGNSNISKKKSPWSLGFHDPMLTSAYCSNGLEKKHQLDFILASWELTYPLPFQYFWVDDVPFVFRWDMWFSDRSLEGISSSHVSKKNLSPEYPDPSKAWRFWEPKHPCVIQVPSPFHCRVQSLILRVVCFTFVTLFPSPRRDPWDWSKGKYYMKFVDRLLDVTVKYSSPMDPTGNPVWELNITLLRIYKVSWLFFWGVGFSNSKTPQTMWLILPIFKKVSQNGTKKNLQEKRWLKDLKLKSEYLFVTTYSYIASRDHPPFSYGRKFIMN